MSKIKVLHYLRHLALGGTEKTCQLFFEYAGKEFEVAVVYEKSGTHPRMDEFRKSAMVCGGTMWAIDSYDVVRNINSGLQYTPHGRELQSVIDVFQPNILHVYRSGYNEFPEPGLHIEVPHFIETNVFGFYDPNPKIDRSLFMSKWLMQNTIRQLGHKPDRFDFVNNPVEMPYTNDILPIAQRWQNENAIIVGRCGRPDNGIYNSINVEAVRLLRMQGYDIRFLVVAPPSNMISDLSRYEIPFYMIEPTVNPLVLSMFYNSIDIFAHARADGESGGCAIQEATIHKKSIVTHIATPSIPGMGVFNAQVELVENGKTGYIVNNNPLEYSEALKLLILDRDLRLQFGENAFSKAINEYEINVCMKKLENIYNDIMGQS